VDEKELVILMLCDGPIWVTSGLSVFTIPSFLFGVDWPTFTSPFTETHSRVPGSPSEVISHAGHLNNIAATKHTHTHTHTHTHMSPVFIYWWKIRRRTDLLMLERMVVCFNSVTEFLLKSWRAWCNVWKQVERKIQCPNHLTQIEPHDTAFEKTTRTLTLEIST
jgi:hypothetical protein